ncbi:hypothetical protein BpHYR1_021920 [Brachionus plicatilis]|uniref:Uncharacterized protein n=1 Tax=Brachionus plicatilis TaxID=10195 RepID=A0A3M7PMF4_BRAPC|nr:hypothetical protein BpHYR1_021920 [Brachionus plicatilis]
MGNLNFTLREFQFLFGSLFANQQHSAVVIKDRAKINKTHLYSSVFKPRPSLFLSFRLEIRF